MQNSVLVFILNTKNQVLLGKRKNTNYANNKWNGFGGKVSEGEGLEEAAVREVFEEAKITITREQLSKAGKIFYKEPKKDWVVNVFIVKSYIGKEASPTLEMEPKWFSLTNLPLDQMWENDRLWVEGVLFGNYVKGYVENDSFGNVLNHSLGLNKHP